MNSRVIEAMEQKMVSKITVITDFDCMPNMIPDKYNFVIL